MPQNQPRDIRKNPPPNFQGVLNHGLPDLLIAVHVKDSENFLTATNAPLEHELNRFVNAVHMIRRPVI